MGSWDTIVDRFQSFGGVLNNVELRDGVFGRGLFSKNEKLPVKISVPNNLLMPVDLLQLDEQGNLILTESCDWGNEAKEFYLDYQRNYGLTNALIEEMLLKQSQIADLPSNIKNMLLGYGFGSDVFAEPSRQHCLDSYKKSRRIYTADRKLVLMPLLELVNHNENAKKTFEKVPKISISGRFKDEILVNYGMGGDAALMYEAYGFTSPKPYTFSGTLSINLGSKVITIARFVNIHNNIGKTYVPKLKLEGNVIHLSYLVLGSMNDRNSPKRIFQKIMHDVGMPAHVAENTFNGILEQNKNFFLHLLEELKPLNGHVVEGLRTMARNQLIPLGVKI